jgi:signal transduction histidine kinase
MTLNYSYCRFLLFILLPVTGLAQQHMPDSLQQLLKTAVIDSVRFDITRQLYTYYEEKNRDSALYYTDERLLLAKRNRKKIAEAYVMGQKAYQLTYLGRFGEALQFLLAAIPIVENPANEEMDSWMLSSYDTPGKSRLQTLSMLNHMFGHLMLRTHNVEQELYRFKAGRNIGLEIGSKFRIMAADMVLGSCYVMLQEPDSALFFAKEGEKAAMEAGIKKYYGYLWTVMADVYLQKGNLQLAADYYSKSMQSSIEQNNITNLAGNYMRLTGLYRQEGKKDSVLLYALKSLAAFRSIGAVTSTSAYEINLGTAYEDVSKAYLLNGQFDSAFKYQGLALITKDSINAIKFKRLTDFQNLSLNEALRLQHIEKEKLTYQNTIRTYAMLAGIAVFMAITFLLYRNNRNRRKTNAVLKVQKEDLQTTLAELKAAQHQLIQSEKMASLGELTAGIAHEIQNPLNFVNNFSEVSNELMDEMVTEIEKGDLEEAKAIANDIKQNLEKINHHGKRADAIVKGMLQHSQRSSGQKEPADINALADEYLRLAYHGLRAKDKDFNAILKTAFDPALEQVAIIPQDIGRVLLNLYNNAFYATNERKRKQAGNYDPIVTVSTSSNSCPSGGRGVQIKVTDNGGGISPAIVDKIFQPFFTTKPTGQGTGLGLSLAYDIVKAHGGELKVETKEKEGTDFIIQLPVTDNFKRSKV